MVHVLHFPLADKRILLTGFSQHTILIAISHFQLFRRVAAALPGMEQTEPKKGESILCLFFYLHVFIYAHYAVD